MSAEQELENIRKGLEEESRSLNEERKVLEDRVKMLREKVAIEELRRNNTTTRDVISQLKAEINELEQRLNGTAVAPAPSQQSQENTTENTAIVNPEATAVPEIHQQSENKKKEEKRRIFF
jgi:uncharacterized protein YukE